jgi:hypothetical protein
MTLKISRTPPSLPASQRLWLRNGSFPDGEYHSQLHGLANHLACHRAKEVARFSSRCTSMPTVNGDRWRFAFRSSPLTRTIMVQMLLAPASTGDPAGLLEIRNGAGTLIGTARCEGALSAAGDTPAGVASAIGILDDGTGVVAELDASTDYYGLFTEESTGRILSATAWELAQLPDEANGYLEQAFPAFSPIFDDHRASLATLARDLWTDGAAHTWNWTVDDQGTRPATRTSATPANLIDTSVTTVSAASPGVTLDLASRSTLRRSTVPMAFKAFASKLTGSGTVTLKSAAGATLATLTVNSVTEQWWSTTVSLPASSAKYDVHIAGDGVDQIEVYAVSLYQVE